MSDNVSVPRSVSRPLRQKTVGILGGMSNQATGEYYRLLNNRLNAALGGWDNGEIIIVSVNFGNIEHFVRNDQWEHAEAYLSAKIDALERAGADVIICVSNTMHRVVEPIMESRSTSFIHIADPTGQAISKAGLRKVGLLGTMPVMRSTALRERFHDRYGVDLIVPDDHDAAIVDAIIFDELVRGQLKASSKSTYLAIIAKLRDAGAEGLILGCTEIFLLVDQPDLPGFPVFDTASLHVEAAAQFAQSG